MSPSQQLSVGFCTLCCVTVLFCKCSFSPLLVSCHLWLLPEWQEKSSLLLPPHTGGGFSATSPLFVRLFRMLISAQPFKASMACKEYSAVFLSLRINKDKTAIRVKCLAQLSVWVMLNLKGRCKRGGSAAANFDSRFSRSFSESCGCAKGLGWPRWPVSSPIFVWAVLGLSSLSIKKSSAYHKRGSVRDGRWMPTHRAEQCESIAAMPWFMVSHFQSKIGKAVAIPCRLSSTSDLAEGHVHLLEGCEAARTPRLGWWATI